MRSYQPFYKNETLYDPISTVRLTRDVPGHRRFCSGAAARAWLEHLVTADTTPFFEGVTIAPGVLPLPDLMAALQERGGLWAYRAFFTPYPPQEAFVQVIAEIRRAPGFNLVVFVSDGDEAKNFLAEAVWG